MNDARSRHECFENCIRNFSRNCRRHHSGGKEIIIIKMGLKGRWRGVDSCSSWQGPVAGSNGHEDKILVFIKFGGIDKVQDSQLLKKNSRPWSSLTMCLSTHHKWPHFVFGQLPNGCSYSFFPSIVRIKCQQFLADCTSLTLHTPSFSTPDSPHHVFSRISEKWSQDFFLPSNFLVFFIITFIMAAIMTGPTSRMEFRDWLLVSACALWLVEL
jgi:hypothetical protein